MRIHEHNQMNEKEVERPYVYLTGSQKMSLCMVSIMVLAVLIGGFGTLIWLVT